MKKFIIRLFLFFLAFGTFLSPLLLFKIGGTDLKYIDKPTAAIIDKHKRLEFINSPKLIIIGGSNAFFGIDSEMLSREMDINVVNMAQFAGYGLDFMLKEVSDNIENGDILLISIEYFLNLDCNIKAKEDILRYYHPAYKYFNIKRSSIFIRLRNNILNNIESIQNIVLKPIKNASSIYVQSRTINEYGDEIGYLSYENPDGYAGDQKLQYRIYEGIDLINRFTIMAKESGASVYFVFPPFPITEYKNNETVIRKYYLDVKQDLQAKVICQPQDMVFDDSMFFDTRYHLDKNGRERRTKRIVDYLKLIKDYNN
jgi:hypothetical protein